MKKLVITSSVFTLVTIVLVFELYSLYHYEKFNSYEYQIPIDSYGRINEKDQYNAIKNSVDAKMAYVSFWNESYGGNSEYFDTDKNIIELNIRIPMKVYYDKKADIWAICERKIASNNKYVFFSSDGVVLYSWKPIGF